MDSMMDLVSQRVWAKRCPMITSIINFTELQNLHILLFLIKNTSAIFIDLKFHRAADFNCHTIWKKNSEQTENGNLFLGH